MLHGYETLEALTADLKALLDKMPVMPPITSENYLYLGVLDEHLGKVANKAVTILLNDMFELTPEILEMSQPLVKYAMYYNKAQFWVMAKDRQNHALDVLWAFDEARRANMLLVWREREKFYETTKEYIAVLGLLALEDKLTAMRYSDLVLDGLYEKLSKEAMLYLSATNSY